MKKDISLYIHIPFCISKCSYCDFYSIPVGTTLVPQEYVDALCKEITYRISNYKEKQISTIYIGGGTPSLLNQNQLQQISNTILSQTELTADYEFTIEVNPDDITTELLEVFEKCGINRLSCGIQSLNDKCLKFMNRRAGEKENVSALNLLKYHWNGQLSLDVICGLPDETEETFYESLKTVVNANPDHISMYSLTIEEETPLGQLYEKGEIEYDFNFADDLWLKGREFLMKNGYSQYEVSNFSKENKMCKHNLVYWQHEDYLGCGSGGTGTVYDSKGCGYRWTNIKNTKTYTDFWISETINEKEVPQEIENIELEDSVFEYYMMGFRKLEGINTEDFCKKFKFNIPKKDLVVFDKWIEEKLMEKTESNSSIQYGLNLQGILFLNRLLEELLTLRDTEEL